MRKIKLSNFSLLIAIIILLPNSIFGQNIFNKANISGSFQTDVHYYIEDTIIGATDENINGEKVGMNTFANITYTLGKFKAGVRYESYMNPLVGFEDDYKGNGIAHRYASFRQDDFEITIGNFYGQFGNGLIFRSYENWNLGYDNSMDGISVKFNPVQGITLKGVYGSQRLYWKDFKDDNRGIVRGFDAEFFANDLFKSMQNSKLKLILGGSVVSKYQADDPFARFLYPENVSAFAGRFNISRTKVNIIGEYAHKINDPSSINNNIYKDGHAAFLSANYSQKGFGIVLAAKRIDNFSFRSDRNEIGNALDISFLPALSKEHIYTLAAMYPYATKPNGEVGISGQVIYTIPKKSALGGKYGISLIANYSRIHNIDKQIADGETTILEAGTEGYKSNFFDIGDELFFEDFTFEITKKFNKVFKTSAMFTNLTYNIDVIEHDAEEGEKYHANIGVLEMTYKFTPKKALRLEMQYLDTKQDSGSWGMIIFEYSIAPKWFFAISDQYNFKNKQNSRDYHYYNFAFGYTRSSTRVLLSYGRQRDGLLCVGGVCRPVPAATGFKLTITSNF